MSSDKAAVRLWHYKQALCDSFILKINFPPIRKSFLLRQLPTIGYDQVNMLNLFVLR